LHIAKTSSVLACPAASNLLVGFLLVGFSFAKEKAIWIGGQVGPGYRVVMFVAVIVIAPPTERPLSPARL